MKQVPLSEIILALESGSRPKGGAGSEGDVPSLGGEHLGDNGCFRFVNMKRVDQDFYDRMKKGRIRCRDILIVKDGATTGRTCFVDDDFPFPVAGINEHVFRLEVDESLAWPKFVYHYLKSSRGRAQVLLDFRGATVGGITRGFIEKVLVPLPAIDVQQSIARRLDQATELAEPSGRARNLVQELAHAIFQDIFGDPLDNLMGWQGVTLGDLCSRVTDGEHQTPPRTSAGIPLLSARNVRDGWIDFETTDFVSGEEYQVLRRRIEPRTGDILVSCSGTIGRVSRVKEDVDFAMVRSVAIIRPGDNVNAVFLEGLLRTHKMRSLMILRANSSAQANLFQNQIKSLPAILPPRDLQEAYATRINLLEPLLASVGHATTCLEELRASLVDTAFERLNNDCLDAR